MIKKGILNFFKSLKYYFPALGILSFGIFIGLGIFITLARSQLENLLTLAENATSDSSTINVSAFKDTIIESIKSLPWNNFFKALEEFFNIDFLKSTLKDSVIAVIGEDNLNEALGTSINSTAESISQGFVLFLLWLILGILSCFLYSKIVIKKDLKMKVSLKKTIFVIIVNYILNITLVALITYLLGLFPLGALLTLFIMLMLNQAISLFEAYLSRSQKKMKFKKVFSFKTVLKLSLVSIITLIIVIIFISIISLISNESIAYILAIPLISIYVSVISFNAYSYIRDYYTDKDLIEERK